MKKSFLLYIFLFLYTTLFAFVQQDILDPKDAFKASAIVQDDHIHTEIKLGEQIYVYDAELKYKIIEPKEIELDALINRPKPVEFHEFIVHREDIIVDIPLKLIQKQIGTDKFKLKLEYQGCSEKGLCYQPMENIFTFDTSSVVKSDKKEVVKTEKESSTVNASEEDQIADTLKNSSIFTILATFFGFGLLLALTPCVFPMIPILSSIIVSQSDDKMSAKKGFLLSLVYVLAMAFAYTIAGVLAGLFGANIQSALQNPYVIVIFSAIFIALAFSMFGYYHIDLPKSLKDKLHKKSDAAKGKGIMGVAVMGFLSALIVGPCVAPPLAGALVYIGQTGDAVLGGAALFVMSLGMGVPLLLVGIGAGKFMPKPGGWMAKVSQVFGVVMLAIAVWMLSRIIPESITMFLWAALFIGSAVYAGAFEPFKEHIAGYLKLTKVFALLLFIIGTLLFIGAVSGAKNLFNPLEKFTTPQIAGAIQQKKNTFEVVKTVAALEEKVKNAGKYVMIDFYADWCVSCKELEHNTFADQNVKSLMQDFLLLKVDVTDNTDEDKKLLKKYGVFGPPAIIFYDKKGTELTNHKVIGYKPPNEFIEILKNVKGN